VLPSEQFPNGVAEVGKAQRDGRVAVP
jgi:hypothetical protein